MAKIRVRARAVDMLGRQQIAGIPTAMHELLKNAHDAYAEHVIIDFYRADELVILRDDGLGMTRQEFEEKWLTLGTESKVGANDDPVRDQKAPRGSAIRPIMGEKGIGRLAIAAVGPQVIVLTRASRSEGLSDLTVSLIHWGLFELPGVDLDQVDIPIEELPGGSLPGLDVMSALADRIRANVAALGGLVPPRYAARILDDLSKAEIDVALLESRLSGPSLKDDGFGTHFLIRPSNPVLEDDIDGGDDGIASPVQRMLLGFSNTMLPNRPKPGIVATFRDHQRDGAVSELIGGNAFFTPEEFESADHHIEGRFDAFGQFTGTVKVYGNAPKAYTVSWPNPLGKASDCGPFDVRFAYVQGLPKDTRLPLDVWALLIAKLNRIGGLYVYRDGIRILPYGNSDVDFLNIERRRTLSASDWFFSYRRVFGVIEISHAANGALVEKAGREGFRTNKAYREFVSMLENLFQRLALDFFRETAQYGEEFNRTKAELNAEAEILKRREKSTRSRRKILNDQLNEFFKVIERGVPSSEADRVREETRSSLTKVREISDLDKAAAELLRIESVSRRAVDELVSRITVTRPRGVGLTKSQQSDWVAYARNVEKVQRDVIAPLKEFISDSVTMCAEESGISVEKRQRILATLAAGRSSATSSVIRLRREVTKALSSLQEAAEASSRSTVGDVLKGLEEIDMRFARTDISAATDGDLPALQQRWEQAIADIAVPARSSLEALRDQLNSLSRALRDSETLDATTAAIETRSEALQDQVDQYAELAQLGMAVGIIQHEFSVVVTKVRDAINDLEPWKGRAKELGAIHDALRTGFDQLEGYLRLFTPLSRRMNLHSIELTGETIRIYLQEVFGHRLDDLGIALKSSKAFDFHTTHGSPAAFLPAFVNLVDNAIYWISVGALDEKEIFLDVSGNSMIVRNTGPGIERRVSERIFDFGESTKPGGRGMGLYLSRTSLGHAGYDLTLRTEGLDAHPEFIISPALSKDDEVDP